MALGAGKLRVVMGIVLPCAMPGVLTAVILAMGRIVGESAALLFTSGLSYNMPKGFWSQIFASGRTLTLHLYQTAREASSPDSMHIAYATAAVLLILVFLLNRLVAGRTHGRYSLSRPHQGNAQRSCLLPFAQQDRAGVVRVD